MVIDTSAMLAVLFDEPERPAFTQLIARAERKRLSAATLVELSIVVQARWEDSGERVLDLFIAKAGIDIIPVDTDQARLARLAWKQFGKGRHPAALNYGDCFSYALARSVTEPLLFKGNDFARTDIEPAWSGTLDSTDPGVEQT